MTFDDGTIWDLQGALILTGTSANENMMGTTFDDVIYGLGGSDNLIGYAGNDTYILERGFSASGSYDVINEAAGYGADTIRFTGGVLPSEVRIYTDSLYLYIEIVDDPNSRLRFANTSFGSDGVVVGDVEYISFDNGTVWDLQTSLTLTGTNANESLLGTAFDDVIYGLGGNDQLNGYNGNDTYVFGLNFSSSTSGDNISETATGGNDTIVFEGFTASEIRNWVDSFGTHWYQAISNPAQNTLRVSGGNVENIYYGAFLQAAGYQNDTDDAHVMYGSSGDDEIHGNGGNDTILAFAGNDTLDGGTGADAMTGGLGDDLYIIDNTGDSITENADEGTDTVQSSITYVLSDNLENLTLTGTDAINGTGNVRDNVMTGNSAANVLTSDGGNDTLDGGAGADSLVGGTGDDTYVVDDIADSVTENLNEGMDTVRSFITYTLDDNLENLVLLGGSPVNGTGNASDNTMTGNSAANILTAQGGNDTLDGGAGADSLVGGTGDDTYFVDNIGDSVTENLNEGTDIVFASATHALSANVENLTLTGVSAINGAGNALDNIILGNSGANTLDGGAGADSLAGGAGDDVYVVDNAGDLVTENADEGTDTVQSSITYALGDTLEHLTLIGSADVNATGNDFDNIILGNSGNNTLDGFAGADSLAGGGGNDVYVVDSLGDTVSENADEGTDTVQSSVSFTLGDNLENLTLAGAAAITGTGNALDNIISSNGGDNVLTGMAGNDTLSGGNGSDTYSFADGHGLDTVNDIGGIHDTVLFDASVTVASVSYSRSGNDLVIEYGTGSDSITVTGFFASLDYQIEEVDFFDGTVHTSAYIEQLVNSGAGGTPGDDTLTGTPGDDVLQGLAGNDTIFGLAGHDTLDGGFGADSMEGSTGDDVYIVDDAGDAVVENLNEGTDTVRSSISYTLGDNVENLVLSGMMGVIGTGNALDNIITSNGTDNTLDGAEGADTMAASTGNDTYVVDNAGDLVIENLGAGTDTVLSGISYALTSNVENLTLTGTADLTATGNDLANSLTGNAGNNVLDGFAGADVMAGGAGNDIYIVDDLGDLVTENPDEGTDSVQSGVSYALSTNVENLTLTGAADINATGNALANTLTGNGGANILSGGSGNDLLAGGAGSDSYAFANGDGQDVVTDSSGSLDRIVFDASVAVASVVYDQNGDDLVIQYGAGSDSVTVTGFFASADNQIEEAHFFDGTVHDAAYIQQQVASGGTAGDDTLTGTAGDDTLQGLGGNDVLNGLEGHDTLDGGTGIDAMTGGLGDDTYIVDNAGDSVVENPGEGTDTVQSSISYTLGSNLENLTLTGTAVLNGTGNTLDNVMVGNSAANVLTSDGGADTLDGGADTLDGGAGADSLVGGTGNDLYIVDNAGDVITELGTGGVDTVQSSISWTLGSNLEHLTLTGSDNINATGNNLANILTGNSGNNILTAGGGADTMQGGFGDDTYVINNAVDVIIENAGEGIDTVISDLNWTLAANIENLTLTGTAGIDGTGNELSNVITGTSGANVLNGMGGNDMLIGGLGNDIYYVDSAGDSIIEAEDAGIDIVYSSVSFMIYEYVEKLTLTGTDNIDATGNSLDNTLTGNTGNNTLDGGLGADKMIGGGGNDTYIVDDAGDIVVDGSGIDTVIAYVSYTMAGGIENLILAGDGEIDGSGNLLGNNITGNGRDNTITGSGGIDTLAGMNGDDYLNGSGGADTMDGGWGDDSFVVDNAGDVLIEDAGQGSDTVITDLDYVLGANLENLTLTGAGNRTGTGNAANNVLTGNSGDNTLDGMGGNDTLSGDGGNDVYVVDSANDVVIEALNGGTDTVLASASYVLSANIENLTLTGTVNINGTGNDLNNTLTGNTGANALSGGLGNDTYVVDNIGDTVIENLNAGTDLVLSSVNFSLSADVENLTLTGSALNGTGNDLANTLTGNSGANTLDGGAGADVMNGDGGNDTYIIDNVGDVVIDNGGTDTIRSSITYALNSGIENLVLTGTENINGTGNSASNVITGNSGNNLLAGGGGADDFFGGAGDDIYVVDSTTDSVTENLNEGTDTVQSSVNWTLSANVEHLVLTGIANRTGTGNALNNSLTGNSGDNVLDGLGGDDVMAGDGGNDTYLVDSIGDLVTELLNGGTDTVESAIAYALGENLENLVLTGSAAINGTGNELNNSLTGNSGSNTLDGGLGADVMAGGGGDDTFIVDNAGDLVSDSGGKDHVISSVSFTLGGGLENLTLTGSADINGTGNGLGNIITGNSGNNVLTGGASIDTLIGGAGNDTLDGSGGNDSMSGGLGDDYYVVANANDQVIEQLDEGTDTVQASLDYALTANVENLILTGTGNIDGTGNALNNIITGNAGNNILTGNDGDDILSGGGGLDTLWGNLGADTFLFEAATAYNNIDVIKDFNTGQGDVIDISDLLTGYDSQTMLLTDFVDITDAGADSALRVDRDGAGTAFGFVQVATIQGVTGLTDEAQLVANGNLLVG